MHSNRLATMSCKNLVVKLTIALAVIASAQFSVAEVNSVSVRSRLDPNAVLITEIDIIFVYDADIANNFPATKSSWYSGKRAFTREAGDGLDLVNIFIPQGFDSVEATLPARKNEAVKVFIFAYHDDSQAAPIDVTDFIDVSVAIDQFGILVTSG